MRIVTDDVNLSLKSSIFGIKGIVFISLLNLQLSQKLILIYTLIEKVTEWKCQLVTFRQLLVRILVYFHSKSYSPLLLDLSKA